ncbi:MAG: signal peptide peptidase SppA [Bacteroidales bacterium]|jgi:protease-4|nr:signal peptide peptidase SppA [Bacteroidales bacterium]MCI1734003.1 signal peptide peptidase SppA [Bacteroidales bacterium]
MNNFWKTFLAALCGTLAALFVCMLMFFAFVGSIASLAEKTEPSVPSSAILKIDLSKPVGERTQNDPFKGFNPAAFQFNISNEGTLGVYDAVRAIKTAADDPAIKLILITNLDTPNYGVANMEEVRKALADFHDSGKPIIAYGINCSQGGYYLASVADKIYINKAGTAQIVGLGTSMMFFKDLLDKLGVQVELIRHGKYKSAAEQYVKSDISPENKEQSLAMLNSIWGTWVKAICKSRNISPVTFNDEVNNLKIWDAESMVANKLADGSVTNTEMTQKLCDLFGVKEDKNLKYVSLADYAAAKVKPDTKSRNKIAVLYAEGEITMSGADGITAKDLCPVIKKLRKDSSVKAVVFRVNSPGGEAQAAEVIREELQLLKKVKPVICSYGEYAASGGYWISAQANKIFTDATTLTGSIGVYSLVFNYGKGLKEHLNINTVSFGTNAHSTMSSGISPLKPEEQIYMQQFVEKIYSQFTSIAADGRKLPVAYVDSIGQGRVWTGEQGIQKKLTDYIGGLDDAIAFAAKYAKLSSYRVVEYPSVKTMEEKIMDKISGSESDEASAKILTDPEALIKKAYSSLTKYKGVKTYARLPYIYEFNY